MVWYWKKDGRLMIEDGRPLAEELLGFAGKPFVLVEGVPLSIALDAAKEHVWKIVKKSAPFVGHLLCGWSQLDAEKHPFGLCVDDDRTASPEDRFFLALKNLYLTQMMRKKPKAEPSGVQEGDFFGTLKRLRKEDKKKPC